MNKTISWALSPLEKLNSDFIWNDIEIIKPGDYYLTTNSLFGFNFLYISIPKNLKFTIYNKLNMILFESSKETDDQIFSVHKTVKSNKILKKNDVYNTYNPVTFKIKIYND